LPPACAGSLLDECGHWVEFSRPLAPRGLDDESERMMEAYEEYFELVRVAARAGESGEQVHRAVSKPFWDRGYNWVT
jgi:hypothetical protein